MPILKIRTGAARSVRNLDLILIRLAFHAEKTGSPVLIDQYNLLLHGALTPRQRVCVHGVQPGFQALFLSSASGVAHIAHRRWIRHRRHATIVVRRVGYCEAICGEILQYNTRDGKHFFWSWLNHEEWHCNHSIPKNQWYRFFCHTLGLYQAFYPQKNLTDTFYQGHRCNHAHQNTSRKKKASKTQSHPAAADFSPT